MEYKSLNEIYEEKQAVLDSISKTVSRFSPAQQRFKISDDKWSISQNVEHLSFVESRIIKLIEALIKKAEMKAENKSMKDFAVSFSTEAEDILGKKLKTASEYEPGGRISIDESLKILYSIQDRMIELKPEIAIVDTSSVKFQHPFLGNIDLGQWLAVVGIHEQRHLDQINSIISSPGFPST
jgi:DinB superfamily